MPVDTSRAIVRHARCRVLQRLLSTLVALSLIVVAAGCARFRLAHEVTPRYEVHSSEEHADFGVVYEQSGDLDAAARQYQWAVKKDPENTVAWTNLGNVQAQRQAWDAAREAYRAALALDPGYGPAANNLACTYLDESPPDPVQAEALLRAHLDIAGDAYRDTLLETVRRAQEMTAP